MSPGRRAAAAAALALAVYGLLLGESDFATLHGSVDALIAAGPAALAYAGALLALPRERTVLDEVRALNIAGAGIDEEQLAAVLADARPRVARLRALAEEVRNGASEQIADIAATAERIVEGFIEDPNDVRRSRTFLNHHLPNTVEVVEKYLALQAKAEHSTSARDALGKFRETLADVDRMFRNQYEKNLSDDVATFDVDLAAMRALARDEGV